MPQACVQGHVDRADAYLSRVQQGPCARIKHSDGTARMAEAILPNGDKGVTSLPVYRHGKGIDTPVHTPCPQKPCGLWINGAYAASVGGIGHKDAASLLINDHIARMCESRHDAHRAAMWPHGD